MSSPQILTKTSGHIDALTSLRFFAAFYVLLFHSGGPTLVASGRLPAFAANFFANGYLGVQFFFVLSGFILTYVYYGKIHTRSDVTNFAWNRFARLYPVYMLALLLSLPATTEWQSWRGWFQIFLLQSWEPVYLLDENLLVNSNQPAWTLSVELFFYLLFPFVITWIARQTTRSVVMLAVFTSAIMLAFRTAGVASASHLIFDFMRYIPVPVVRFPEFLYGICAGVLFVRGMIPISPQTLIVLAIALMGVLCASNSHWVAPFATILSGAIIAMTPNSLGTGVAARILSSRALTLLGGASYSLYLLQTAVNWWMKEIAGDYQILARVLYIPTLVLISVVVFLYFEEPMRRLLRRAFA